MAEDGSNKDSDRPRVSHVHETAEIPRNQWRYLVNEKREAEAAIAEAEQFIDEVQLRGGKIIDLTKARQLMRDAYAYSDVQIEDYFTAMRKALEAKTSALITILNYQTKQNNSLQDKLASAEPEVTICDLAGLTAFLETRVDKQIIEDYFSQKLELWLGMSLEDILAKSKTIQDQQARVTKLEQTYIERVRELQIREERLTAREKSLQEKIDALESGDDVSDKLDQLRKLELRQQRSSLGINYLDDLLYGGLPFGSNLMVYGPSQANKEIISNRFLLTGLKMNVPAVVILTDTDINQKRQELLKFDPDYVRYEEKGLVEYIVISSKRTRRKQVAQESKYAFDINELNPEKIFETFDEIISGFEKRYGERHYRLVFEYITTVDRKLKDKFTDFFKDLTSWVREDSAVGIYLAETTEEQEINALSRGRTIDCMVGLDGEKIRVDGLGTLEIKDDRSSSYSVKGNMIFPRNVVR